MYKPLPPFLEIKDSDIEGKGIFVNTDLPKGIILGLTHIRDKEFPDDLIRTPLGGFINHANLPNCKLIQTGRLFFIETKKAIKAGNEITLRYRIAKLEQKW